LEKEEYQIFEDVYMDVIGDWEIDDSEEGTIEFKQPGSMGMITIQGFVRDPDDDIEVEAKRFIQGIIDEGELPNPIVKYKQFSNDYSDFKFATMLNIDPGVAGYFNVTATQDTYILAVYIYEKVTEQAEIARSMIDSIRSVSEAEDDSQDSEDEQANQETTETQRAIFNVLEKRMNGILKVNRYSDDSSGKFVDLIQIKDAKFDDKMMYTTIGTSELPVRIFDDGRTMGVEVVAIGGKAYPTLEEIVAVCGLDLLGLYQEIEPGCVHQNAVAEFFPNRDMKHIYYAYLPESLDDLFGDVIIGDKIITWLMATPISDAELAYLNEHGFRKLDELLLSNGADLTDLGRKCVLKIEDKEPGGANMSKEAYLRAKALIEEHEDLADFNDGCDKELIKSVGDKLGFNFSGSYYDFLIDFGVGGFGGTEIYGIIDFYFEGSGIPDAAWATYNEREKWNLKKHYFVIGSDGMGGNICLDFSNMKNGEPVVVIVEGDEHEVIADSFGEYLLEEVTQEINGNIESEGEPSNASKQNEISADNKAIARYLVEKFGSPDIIQGTSDEAGKSFIDIFEKSDPKTGEITFCSLGLSDQPVRNLKDGRHLGVEILAVGTSEYEHHDSILSTCCYNLLNSGIAIEPRTVHKNVVQMYYPNLEMKHIYFAPPFLWEGILENLEFETKVVTYLLTIPISDEELAYLDKYGAEKFEDLLEERNIVVSDLGRKSVVRNESKKAGFFNRLFNKGQS
jgi:hypothetical protein